MILLKMVESELVCIDGGGVQLCLNQASRQR